MPLAASFPSEAWEIVSKSIYLPCKGWGETYPKDRSGDSRTTLELIINHATSTLARCQGESGAGSSSAISSTSSGGVPVSTANEASILLTHNSYGEITLSGEGTGGSWAARSGGGWWLSAPTVLREVSNAGVRAG